jgi:hypothetical protein
VWSGDEIGTEVIVLVVEAEEKECGRGESVACGEGGVGYGECVVRSDKGTSRGGDYEMEGEEEEER